MFVRGTDLEAGARALGVTSGQNRCLRAANSVVGTAVLSMSTDAIATSPRFSIGVMGGPYDAVAEEYESGRPGYPDAVFDALGPIAGLTVLEGGGDGLGNAEPAYPGSEVGGVSTSASASCHGRGDRRRGSCASSPTARRCPSVMTAPTFSASRSRGTGSMSDGEQRRPETTRARPLGAMIAYDGVTRTDPVDVR